MGYFNNNSKLFAFKPRNNREAYKLLFHIRLRSFYNIAEHCPLDFRGPGALQYFAHAKEVAIFRILLSTVFILLQSLPLFAADYYTDNRVSSSGNGSNTSPFKSIQEGIDRLSPGDTLLIRGNSVGLIYNEGLSLPINGNTTQEMIVKAYPNEKVVITGTAGTRLNLNRDYWVFQDLTVDQGNATSDAIKVNGDHIVLRNLEIRNGQREGISIENATFITIEDSYIHNFFWIDGGTRRDAHCIMIDTDRSPSITDIMIRGNTIEKCSGDGIQIFGETGQAITSYAKNIQILDNVFIDGSSQSGQTENALDFKAGDTVLVKGNTMTGYKNNKTIVVQKGCRNITIEENRIGDGLSGIEMRQEGGASFIQENNSVIKNIIYDMTSYALKFDGLKNLTVVNNTLVNIGSNAFRFESGLGGSVPSVDGGLMKNNLVYLSGNPSIKSPFSNLDISHNGWFQSSAGSLSHGSDTSGSDPLFEGLGSHDYRLKTGSPAIDAGTLAGFNYNGSAPDLGALEHNPGQDTTPPSTPTGLQISG